MAAKQRLMIIDNDAGTDDAQAILMALAESNINVIALTCVAGNAVVDKVALNCLRILKLDNRLDIPVYKGASLSLLGHTTLNGQKTIGNGFHGEDGLGDVPDNNAPDASNIQKEHAVTALTRLVNQYPGEVELVTLGPLTNIAMAIRMDPQFCQKIKCCYIMGGNHYGKGNVTVAGEFNFACDPEAAFVVLNELKCPMTIATFEGCVDAYPSWEWYKKLLAIGNEKAKFIKNIDIKLVETLKMKEVGLYMGWDQLAVAVALNSDVAEESKNVYATIELSGQMTRGQMVVDWAGQIKKTPNVEIITKVNQKLYEKCMYDAIL